MSPNNVLHNVLHTRYTTRYLHPRHSTRLNSFLGADGGILGVGAPELATIVLIGYFVLGPQELYKLTKEIGKFVNNFRSVGTDLTSQFTDSMENQLAMEEVRKAKDDLEEAFSFRRSINWEEEEEMGGMGGEVGDGGVAAAEGGVGAAAAAASTGTATATATKKKIRKRVKKREPEPEPEPDLSEPSSPSFEEQGPTPEDDARVQDMINSNGYIDPTAEAEGLSEAEGLTVNPTSTYPDLSVDTDFDLYSPPPSLETSETSMLEERSRRLEEAEASRFQSQLNAEEWNQSIIDNADTLNPLAKIMEKLALLEDERSANLKRLEEEMRLKEEMEEKFYREKRKVLEEGIREFQVGASEENVV
ncbi:hypothetical protein TrVE_jg5170 [Triparma verrucosa]|uniref:Uncharacterized protein n=1 Tax=Triparma verrucosa TaxID=1606542 RepID=A0A9W7BD92_9STRA|nr:hypothetical protein TrVE_jg5170 [Triparma verrucosa]